MTRKHKQSNSATVLLGLILVLGTCLRLIGLDWGLPFHLHSDEDVMMYWAEQIRICDRIPDLTTHQYFYVYSPLPLYWTAAGGSLINALHPLEPDDPFSITARYLWARVLSAGLGILSIGVIFLIGKILAGTGTGLIAALLAATAPVHIQNSHFFTAEIPFTFFASLCLFFVLKFAGEQNVVWSLAAGIALGLTLLCKYTAVFLVPVIFITQLVYLPKTYRSLGTWKKNIFFLMIPPAIGLILFFCINPWIFYNYPNFLRTYSMLKDWSSGIQRPLWTAQFSDVNAGWFWITNLIPTGFGIPILCAGLLGLAGIIVLKQRIWVPVIIYGAAYYMLVGFSFMQYIRYTVPLTPFLTVLAAYGIDSVRQFRPSVKLYRYLYWLALCTVAGFTFVRGSAYLSIYTHTDTRLEAAEWIRSSFASDTVILTDNSAFRPPVEDNLQLPHMDQNFVLRGDSNAESGKRFSVRLLDVYLHLYRTDLSPIDKQRYINSRLEDVDLIIFGEEAVTQYRHLRDRYPIMNSFYDDLFSECSSFKLIRTFSRKPNFLFYEWDDSYAELTWRLFDHPTIWIFQRGDQ
jgi:Dolichyl-phosphate-mannose-protein mannosyltransferase